MPPSRSRPLRAIPEPAKPVTPVCKLPAYQLQSLQRPALVLKVPVRCAIPTLQIRAVALLELLTRPARTRIIPPDVIPVLSSTSPCPTSHRAR